MVVIALHAGALSLAFILPLSLGVTAGLTALIILSLWWHNSHGQYAHEHELSLNDDGTLIHSIIGEQRRYHVDDATAHVGFLCFTLVRDGERVSAFLLPRDAIEPEVYRNLLARIAQKRLPVTSQE